MIFVPFRKLGELLTKPVMEPSAFCVHRDKTGILSWGAAFLAGSFLTGDCFVAAAALDGLNKERVGRAGGAFFTGAAFIAGATFGELLGAALGFGAPNKEKAGLGAGTGAGSGVGSGAGFGLKKENEGAAFGAGTGAGGASTLGAGLGLKKEKEGAALGAGTGTGAGSTFGAGLGLKNENAGSAFLGAATGIGAGGGVAFAAGLDPPERKEKEGEGVDFGACFGAGATSTFGAGFGVDSFFAPKNDEKASVTGSLVSILGIGFRFSSTCGSGFGAGAGAGVFAGGLRKFNPTLGREAGLGAGTGAFVTTAGFGVGEDLGAGADFDKKFKLSVGLGAGGCFAGTGVFTGELLVTDLASFGAVESKKEPRLSVDLGAAGLGATCGLVGATFAGGFELEVSEDPKSDPRENVGAARVGFAGAFCEGGDGGGGVGFGLGASRACFSSHSRA